MDLQIQTKASVYYKFASKPSTCIKTIPLDSQVFLAYFKLILLKTRLWKWQARATSVTALTRMTSAYFSFQVNIDQLMKDFEQFLLATITDCIT